MVRVTNCSRSHQAAAVGGAGSELTSPEGVDRDAGGGALGGTSARSRALFDRRGSDPDTAQAAPARSRYTDHSRVLACPRRQKGTATQAWLRQLLPTEGAQPNVAKAESMLPATDIVHAFSDQLLAPGRAAAAISAQTPGHASLNRAQCRAVLLLKMGQCCWTQCNPRTCACQTCSKCVLLVLPDNTT